MDTEDKTELREGNICHSSISKEDWDKAFGVTSPINNDITIGELIKISKYRQEAFSIEITPSHFNFEIKEKCQFTER